MKLSSILSLLLALISSNAQNETDLLDLSCDASCTFPPQPLSSQNLKLWPRDCEKVCADLRITDKTDLTEAQLTSAFKNLKRLVGSLLVMDTKYTSGKFLAGLESVECDDSFFFWTMNPKMQEIGLLNLTTIHCRVYVSSNKNMVRLNVPNLREIISYDANYSYYDDVNIASLSPNFCWSIQEMANFLGNSELRLYYLPGTYCPLEESDTNSTFGKVCEFENTTLSEMEEGCVHVRGDVVVESGDEEHVSKLESVQSIFGSLTVRSTNLTDLDFLEGLRYVAVLEKNEPAIEVHHNPNLMNVTLPSLKRVRADIRHSIVFTNNSLELTLDPDICFEMRNSLNLTDDWTPTIDGKTCESIRVAKIVRDRASNGSSSLALQVFTTLLVTFFVISRSSFS